MTTPAQTNIIDVRTILTGVITAALVSVSSFLWMMGGVENRVNVLEREGSKVDQILLKVNELGEKVAVMSNDMGYVKQNVSELKLNSTSLGDDVRNLRVTVADIQKGNTHGR